MTTKITVDAHAGWPVKIVFNVPGKDDLPDREEIVAPNTVRDFSIHDSRNIVLIEEMKRDQS